MFDNFSWYSRYKGVWGYVAGDDSPGGDNRLVANGNTINDGHIGHNPYPFANIHGLDCERIYLFEWRLCGDAAMGGDGATVANGGVVTNGDLLRESAVEKYVVSDVDTLADMDAAPPTHRPPPSLEGDKEGNP